MDYASGLGVVLSGDGEALYAVQRCLGGTMVGQLWPLSRALTGCASSTGALIPVPNSPVMLHTEKKTGPRIRTVFTP